MRFWLLIAGVTAALSAAADRHAVAQRAIEGRLLEQYRLTDLSPGRPSIGTTVIISKPGLEASPAAVNPTAGATWERGYLKPTFSTTSMSWQLKMPVQAGQRAYITKIESKDSYVIFDLLLPEPVNGVHFRTTVHFEFGKGYWNSPDYGLIERTISEVLQMDQPPQQPAPRQRYTRPPPPPPPPSARQSRISPGQISPGMTTEEVRAALGPPDRVVRFGNKEVHQYGPWRITLVEGRVTEVVKAQP